MAEEETNSDGTTKRLVRATIASAASALIAYGVRKAAPVVRNKLQSAGEGSVPETLGKAKDAVGEKVEAATSAVTDRIGSAPSKAGSKLPDAEIEKRQRERAQNRSEREKALTS